METEQSSRQPSEQAGEQSTGQPLMQRFYAAVKKEQDCLAALAEVKEKVAGIEEIINQLPVPMPDSDLTRGYQSLKGEIEGLKYSVEDARYEVDAAFKALELARGVHSAAIKKSAEAEGILKGAERRLTCLLADIERGVAKDITTQASHLHQLAELRSAVAVLELAYLDAGLKVSNLREDVLDQITPEKLALQPDEVVQAIREQISDRIGRFMPSEITPATIPSRSSVPVEQKYEPQPEVAAINQPVVAPQPVDTHEVPLTENLHKQIIQEASQADTDIHPQFTEPVSDHEQFDPHGNASDHDEVLDLTKEEDDVDMFAIMEGRAKPKPENDDAGEQEVVGKKRGVSIPKVKKKHAVIAIALVALAGGVAMQLNTTPNKEVAKDAAQEAKAPSLPPELLVLQAKNAAVQGKSSSVSVPAGAGFGNRSSAAKPVPGPTAAPGGKNTSLMLNTPGSNYPAVSVPAKFKPVAPKEAEVTKPVEEPVVVKHKMHKKVVKKEAAAPVQTPAPISKPRYREIVIDSEKGAGNE